MLTKFLRQWIMANLAQDIRDMIKAEQEQGKALLESYAVLKAAHDALAAKVEALSQGVGDIPLLQETIAGLRQELADARTAAAMIAEILPDANPEPVAQSEPQAVE
jgi:predicted transcriptional regulator